MPVRGIREGHLCQWIEEPGDGLVSPIAKPRGVIADVSRRSASNGTGAPNATTETVTDDLLDRRIERSILRTQCPPELGLKFTMAADVQTPEQRMDADPMAMAPPDHFVPSDISTNEIVALSLSGAAILIAVVVAAMELRNSDIRCWGKVYSPY